MKKTKQETCKKWMRHKWVAVGAEYKVEAKSYQHQECAFCGGKRDKLIVHNGADAESEG